MVNIDQIRAHISQVLVHMGSKYASEAAIDLILATGIAESGYRYIRQISGPARGFWQIEPDTAKDNIDNYLKYRIPLMEKCSEASHVSMKDWQYASVQDWEDILETNIASGIIHARLKYWRVPKPLIHTTDGMASYWKKYYNTEEGAGTEGHFRDGIMKYLNHFD